MVSLKSVPVLGFGHAAVAFGAAFLAGLGTGVWASQEEIADTWTLERRFEPGHGGPKAPEAAYKQWLKAVERSKGWEERPSR